MKKMVRIWMSVLLVALMLGNLGAVAEGAQQKVKLDEALTAAGLDLTPYKGKAIFLNFFTEWCPYCMEEMGSIKKLFDTYSTDELQIVLVHVWDGEDATNTENVKKTYGMEDMTFFEDEKKAIASWLEIPGYPTSLFLDKEGYLHTALAQAMTYEDMAKIVEEMGVQKALTPAPVPAPVGATGKRP